MELIALEIVWVTASEQLVLPVQVPPGTTLRQAVEHAGLAERVPGLDVARCRAGAYGVLRDWDAPVTAGERVEIYRPLPEDPKALRRKRAASARTGSGRRS